MTLRRPPPAGRIRLRLLSILLMAMALVGYLGYFFSADVDDRSQSPALLHPVVRGNFEHFVTVRGDVESAGSVEIRCLVESQGSPGVAILSIHPQGEYVKKGDFLLQFDDTLFRHALTEQEIAVAQAQALVIQSQSDLRAAEIALEEYVRGAFAQQNTFIESQVFIAQENVRRGEEYLAFSRRLAAKGYVTRTQLEADRFSLEKAKTDLHSAQQKLNLHREYTYRKMVVQLQSQIEIQKANLKAAQSTLALRTGKRDEIQRQVNNCRVVAPQDGQVVYASQTDGRGEEVIMIEEGSVVRQGQAVIRLPDAKQLQVVLRVDEATVGRIHQGKPAFVYADTDPGQALQGRVAQASSFPLTRRRDYEPIEYRAVVDIFAAPPSVRPGLRAKVRIFVDAHRDVLQVPLAAVFVHAGKHYCVAQRAARDWYAQEVQIGPDNDKFVIIQSGLAEGDLVAMNPDDYRELLQIPKTTPSQQNREDADVLASSDG